MRYPLLLFVAVLAGTMPAARAQSTRQLQQQIQRQQARLDQQAQAIADLKAQLGEDWLTRRRHEQVRQLVHEVLADADARAALLDQKLTAGYDNGFYLGSADGNNLLRIRGMIQSRYVFNTRDDSGGDDSRGGFEIARTRFAFTGHVIDPTWQYMIWTGHHYDGGAMLLDAWIKKDLGSGWAVTAGQFKVPFWREYLVSETKQQFVERSLLKSFSGGYTQGVKLDYQNQDLHATLSFNDGAKTLNDPWHTEDTDVALTGRLVWLVFGKWKQYKQFESWRGDKPMLALGGAAHYQEGESGTATEQTDLFRWTVDGTLGLGGANLFAAVIGDHVDNTSAYDRIGVLVQGGYFVTDEVEVIARYEWADLDLAGDDTLSIATVGVNYFFHKHAARWTLDVGYAFEPVASKIHSDFAGYRTDGAGEDGQLVVRTQLQLVF